MSLVTVVMAVCNGEKYLSAAIDSVLAQTYAPIELIVVNDGSQDGTKDILSAYRSKIRSIYQSNQGQPSAQNQGLHRANGRYISFLDADDLYEPNKIALQVEYLEARPQLDLVFGYVQQFISPELPLETRNKWRCPNETYPGYLAAAGLFRKECFEKIGIFNENQKIGPFIEWYMRGCEKGLKHELIQNKLLMRRIHENNMGIDKKNSRQEYIEIIKAALKRRSDVCPQ